jgi:hypothetical protein
MSIIYFKDNISFIYITMSSLRQEIEDEIQRVRLDKTKLYTLLGKLLDQCELSGGEGGGPGVPGPAGPQGPAGANAAPAPVAATPSEAPKKAAPKKKALPGV